MKTVVGVVMSREFPGFHTDAVYTFKNLFSDGVLEFQSDLVETISISIISVSPVFSKFFKPVRPKYYEDKILKIRGSVTPEVRMFKCLLADFVVDFDTYFNASNKEECLKILAVSFVEFWKSLKYPGKLKKFEKEQFLQTVKDIFIKNGIISADDVI
ncbi:hypothetical protein [uncultured Bacteroides sp.]|uniref:hypothetical protein n=1 Tax=uncultured Bacteroides sp. TaxID=162156 RepID=UPI002602FF2E|nr:hypothetical protein [uncultured Bacteroides sp.]